MKNKFFIIISGVMSGMLLVCVVLVVGFLFYSAGNHLIDFIEAKPVRNDNVHIFDKFSKIFDLSFESEDELSLFQIKEAAAKISDKFATKGKYSLMVEYPAGQEYPGIFFDIIGKNCFNWSGIKEFSFDAYNSNDSSVTLTLKLKSGEKYPKREFKKEFILLPDKVNVISVSIDELQKSLDVSKISHLNFFIREPSTTFKIYFDNMKAVRNGE